MNNLINDLKIGDNKIIKATRVNSDGFIEYDFNLNPLKPIVERLKEIGADITIEDLAYIIESKLNGKDLGQEKQTRYFEYSILVSQ